MFSSTSTSTIRRTYVFFILIFGPQNNFLQLYFNRWALRGKNNKPEKLAPPIIDFIQMTEYNCNVLITMDTHADVTTGELVFTGRGANAVSATVDDVSTILVLVLSY